MKKKTEQVKWKEAPPLQKFFTIAFLVIPIFLVGYFVKSCNDYEPTAQPVEVRNGGFNNEVWQVESYLKRNLKDPDSYEGIEWSPVTKVGSGYMVRHKYRAKNSFGGFAIENQVFNLDSLGEVFNVSNY